MLYSPSTTAVLAAVMTDSPWTQPAHYKQTLDSAAAAPTADESTGPYRPGEMCFIKSVPMQHVQSHYSHNSPNMGHHSAGKDASVSQNTDLVSASAALPSWQAGAVLQPFGKLLRVSSDSNSSSE